MGSRCGKERVSVYKLQCLVENVKMMMSARTLDFSIHPAIDGWGFRKAELLRRAKFRAGF